MRRVDVGTLVLTGTTTSNLGMDVGTRARDYSSRREKGTAVRRRGHEDVTRSSRGWEAKKKEKEDQEEKKKDQEEKKEEE